MFYLYVVIFFLWTAICLYLLLGGADFGAGIVELFSSKKNKNRAGKIMYKSMGPVWEANHMWLIIVIVILFVGFPNIYATMSTYVHIPLVLMLIGIIARGTAFSFRNYDVVNDHWQIVYNKIFTWSSLITPFFLGVIAASTVSMTIDTESTDFLSAYIFSWLTPFGCALGIFTISICGFLASCYILPQVKENSDKKFLIKKVKVFQLIVVMAGILVFGAAYISDIPIFEWVYKGTIGQISVILATVSLIGIYYYLKLKKYAPIRILAGFQVIMILLAATYQHYPHLILLKNGTLSLISNEDEPMAIKNLAWALMLGSIFILPGVFHLIYSFQKNSNKAFPK